MCAAELPDPIDPRAPRGRACVWRSRSRVRATQHRRRRIFIERSRPPVPGGNTGLPAMVVGVTTGSGNVFADIALPNPEHELLKAHLTLQIHRIMKERSLANAQARKLLGITAPQAAALMRNRPGDFPVVRLMAFLTALGHDVEIAVKPAGRTRGDIVFVTPQQDPPQAPPPEDGREWRPPQRDPNVL
jgi:predicted XRE-type DNA-binding protein